MDLKKIGIIVVILGIIFTIYFWNNWDYMVLGITVILFGFLIALFGMLDQVKKQKVINEYLERDIDNIIQPLITKYSNLNKEYMKTCSKEEYVQKRHQMSADLEKELTKGLPYLSNNEIKSIVIDFNRNQDKN
ncbi:MAG: hypothetical protein HUK28_03490 [Methanobrevibacter sp.]|nr:hypothetical protein [Methanobrevibacter sp.]